MISGHFGGTVEKRGKAVRDPKTEGATIMEDFKIHYNLARLHESLDGEF